MQSDTPDVDAEAIAVAEDVTPEEQEAVEAPVAEAAEEAASAAAPEETAPAAEVNPYLDDLQRVQAEFANFRRRTQTQQAEQAERAAEAIVTKLLPVLDAGDLAITHGGPEGEAVAKVAGMLMDILMKEGLEGIVPVDGDAFYQSMHDAVAHEEGDTEHPVVAELLRPGYRWKGRLVRPAMVRAKG